MKKEKTARSRSKRAARPAPSKTHTSKKRLSSKAKKKPKPRRVSSKPSKKLQAPSSTSSVSRPKFELNDLPFSYNETKIVLLARDPEWGFAYWDFSADTWQWIESFYRRDPGVQAKIRIHNLDRHRVEDIPVHLDAKNWYLQLGCPGMSFEIELGLCDSNGRFHRIAKSGRVRMPRNGPSEKVDPGWIPPDFEEIYRLSGGSKIFSSSKLFSQFKSS